MTTEKRLVNRVLIRRLNTELVEDTMLPYTIRMTYSERMAIKRRIAKLKDTL